MCPDTIKFLDAVPVIQVFLIIPWSVAFPVEDVRAPYTACFEFETCSEPVDLTGKFVDKLFGPDDEDVHGLDDQNQSLYRGLWRLTASVIGHTIRRTSAAASCEKRQIERMTRMSSNLRR